MMHDGRGLVWRGETEGKQFEDMPGTIVELESLIESIERQEAGEESAETDEAYR